MSNTEGLPLVYSPEIISAYWGSRPGAVATRAVQLLSVAGGFISGIISDLITDKIKEVLSTDQIHTTPYVAAHHMLLTDGAH